MMALWLFGETLAAVIRSPVVLAGLGAACLQPPEPGAIPSGFAAGLRICDGLGLLLLALLELLAKGRSR